MEKCIKNIVATVMLLSIFAVPAAAAASATVQLYYNVPTAVSFTVTMAGGAPAVIGEAPTPTALTSDVWFNATDRNSKDVPAGRNPGAAGANLQNDTNPILMFWNTGTVSLNITGSVNETLTGSGIKVFGRVEAFGTVAGTMGDNKEFTTAPRAIVSGLKSTEKAGLWLYANFTDVEPNGHGHTMTVSGVRE